MNLIGIEFGRAWCSSGARNFYGQGWSHHKFLKGVCLDYKDSTLVCKTTTYEPRVGNDPVEEKTLMLKSFFPKTVKVNFRRQAVLNALGLPGPGLESLLERGVWQTLLKPFVISFMAVDGSFNARKEKSELFAERLQQEKHKFCSPFAVEVNFSCPNISKFDNEPDCFLRHIMLTLKQMGLKLPGVPLIPKINLLMKPEDARELGSSRFCHAICCSNTLPWGSLRDRIPWADLFGEISPLAKYGGGGLSGAPLTPLVLEWVGRYFNCSGPPPVPLIACGGVMTPRDATNLLDLGATAVEIGSVSIVRPWRVQSIIRAINNWKKG